MTDEFSHDDPDVRMPPHHLAAEQAALGGMLLSLRAVEQVTGLIQLKADVFFRPAHQIIYTAICDLFSASRTPQIDPITIAAALDERGDLPRAGGPAYLHTLVSAVPSAANAEYYAGIVLDYAARRRVVEVGTRMVQMGHTMPGEAPDVIDAAMAELQALATGTTPDAAKLTVADRWMGFIDELEAGRDPNAIDTPWPDLNDVVELKPGELVTVGAATGGGKSLVGMNLASHVALTRGRPVLVASMEMGGSELMARLTAAEAGIPMDRVVRRRLTDDDWVKVIRASDRLQNANNFVLDDSPNLTVGKIRARLRWMTSRGTPPALVVADYLQLLTPEKDAGNRTQEVAQISRGLKLLAMEFEVPIVALAQFNRGAAGRQPLVTDFKDSSAIEQDSSVIVLMHRPLAEDGTDTGPRAGEIDLIVAKNRNGAAGRIVTLAFQGHLGRLRSLARDH